MGKWFLIGGAAIVVVAVVAVLIGQSFQYAGVEELTASLIGSAAPPADGTVDFESFAGLPAPVERYFRHVLKDGQRVIRQVTMNQSGVLRSDTTTERWLPFTANHLVVPPTKGFIWKARIGLPLAAHITVLDSYVEGLGSGRVSFLSAFGIDSETGVPELNSGALHRYLAEAVWFPTALLPQSGIEWSPINDQLAVAALTHQGTSVSLEFRINEIGEVTGIYSPGRWGKFEDGYERAPWEGRFRDYHVQSGMRVPRYGEVGWYREGSLELVWKGEVTDARYQFAE